MPTMHRDGEELQNTCQVTRFSDHIRNQGLQNIKNQNKVKKPYKYSTVSETRSTYLHSAAPACFVPYANGSCKHPDPI